MKKKLKKTKTIGEKIEMPLLLTRNVIVFPGCELKIDVGRAHSLISISSGKKKYGSQIVVVAQENPTEEEPSLKKISKFGTLCSFEIHEESEKEVKEEQKIYSLFVKGIKRVRLSKLSFKDNYSATITDYPTDFDQKSKNKVIFEKINFLLINNLDNIFRYYGVIENRLNELRDYLESKDLEKVIFLLANYLPFFSFEKKKEVLVAKKIETMYRILFEDLKKIATREKKQAVEKGYSGHQKIIDKFLKQLNDNPYPEEMKKVIYEEIRNYGMLPPTSSESHVIRSYIETVFSLPWYKESKEVYNLKRARIILEKNHYGLHDVKDRILDYLAVKQWTKKTPRQVILCLVGPTGVGKTSLARSISEAINRKMVKVSLGGIRDVHDIKGHLRTYVGSMPGKIMRAMISAGYRNSLILLDEIDKVSREYYSDPSSALLEVLDPEENKKFVDDYIKIPFSLENVIFIATANYFGDIPQPLRDRMEVIQISSYSEFEKIEIFKNYLLKSVYQEMNLSEKELIFTDEAVVELIRSYTWNSIRELRRLAVKIASKVITKLLEKKTTKEVIDKKALVSYLGSPIFHFYKTLKPEVGTATGLAYINDGYGDIVRIEVVSIPNGSGKLILTGSLGKVMAESAKYSLSYIRANADYFGIKNYEFEKNDIHIHAPEASILKEGPSAGVTITTAIISCLTKKVVPESVGMTGEITLKGNVLPIGGVKEKCIAAERNNLSTLLFPFGNKEDDDFRKLPEAISKKIKGNIKFFDEYKKIYDFLFKEFKPTVKNNKQKKVSGKSN